jgi:hypothetical protein
MPFKRNTFEYTSLYNEAFANVAHIGKWRRSSSFVGYPENRVLEQVADTANFKIGNYKTFKLTRNILTQYV